MIGADIFLILFGLGLLGITLLIGRVALRAAEAGNRRNMILTGVLAVVLGLASMVATLEGLARLFLR